MMSSVVYFVRLGKSGPVKIGYSTNLTQRMRQIGESLPDHLVVEATIEGGRSLELRIHRALFASRRRGEWFNPTAEVEALVAVARHKGEAAVLRWLACKELEVRPPASLSTDDFDNDIRFMVALAFKSACERFGVQAVAQAVGKSVDQVTSYSKGRSLPGVVPFFNLAMLDPGAVVPFFARCGEVPDWISDEAARDAIDEQLAKLAPGRVQK